MPKQADPKIEGFKEYLRDIKKPQEWLDRYGESYNKVIISSRQNKIGVTMRLKLDLVNYINNEFSINTRTDTYGRKYHILNYGLIQSLNSPELTDYFTATKEDMTNRQSDFIRTTREGNYIYNFNFLRFCNIGNKNGLLITFSQYHTEDSIRLWVVEFNRLMKKLENYVAKPLARQFRGTLTVSNNLRIDFNE